MTKMEVDHHIQVPIARTCLDENDVLGLVETLKSGWLVQGPQVSRFEEAWCEFTGARNSIAVTSCTSAMHLSLLASGFKYGDEAIVPAFTWVSTANVVEQCGGSVIFCDIDLDTFNIDVEQIKSKITKKTKAILPVHLFGLAANMEEIMNVAKHYDLFVLEDAACGFGSMINEQHVGTFGNVGCFSFHPRKSITTGEGGMVTTECDLLAEKIRCLRDHGSTISDRQRHIGNKPFLLADHIEAGFNQRMTDIQASLGAAQMERAAEIIEERISLAQKYEKELNDCEWLKLPSVVKGNQHGFQSYPCLFSPEAISISNTSAVGEKRNKFMEELQSVGVSTRPATHAVHMLTYYSRKYDLKPEDFPSAFAANNCSISLPLFNGMTELEQEYVIDAVKRFQF